MGVWARGLDPPSSPTPSFPLDQGLHWPPVDLWERGSRGRLGQGGERWTGPLVDHLQIPPHKPSFLSPQPVSDPAYSLPTSPLGPKVRHEAGDGLDRSPGSLGILSVIPMSRGPLDLKGPLRGTSQVILGVLVSFRRVLQPRGLEKWTALSPWPTIDPTYLSQLDLTRFRRLEVQRD